MAAERAPRVNPTAARLSEHGAPVAEIRGFVVAVNEDNVRVRLALSSNLYADIPRSSIVHFLDAENDNKPSRFFLSGSAQVPVSLQTSAVVAAADLSAPSAPSAPGAPSAPSRAWSPVPSGATATSPSPCGCGGGGGRPSALRARRRADDDWQERNNCLMDCDGKRLRCVDSGVDPDICNGLWRLCYAICRGELSVDLIL
jgi:hypothetical protein